jgi:hypothetical protein
MTDLRRGVALVAIALSVLGCGSAAPSTPGNPTDPPSGASAAATPEPGSIAPSDPAATDAPASAQTGGGPGATEACDLLTVDEVAGVMGTAGLTADGVPGEASYCMFLAPSGDLVAAISLIPRGGRTTFAVWSSASDTIKVDGIGDGATFDPSSASLFVVRGDAIAGFAAGQGDESQEDRLAWAKALAAIAVGRM